MPTSDWRFARRPVWVIGHVVAIGAVLLFLSAARWQLDRHTQRQSLDAEIESRLAQPVVALDAIVDQPPGSIRFRRAEVTGVFDPEEEVVLVLQTLAGVSGHRVLTPLLPSSGRTEAVIVDRGWVPLELDQPGDPRFAAPTGVVTVTGFVRVSQTSGRAVPDTGELDQIGRVDLDRLQQQIDYRLAPVFLHLVESPEGAAELPRPAPLPDLDPGRPHLSYAVQWIVFAIVVVVGYTILMVRTSRRDPGAVSPGG